MTFGKRGVLFAEINEPLSSPKYSELNQKMKKQKLEK